MPTYLAVVTVDAELAPEEVDGMADALGARESRADGGRVVLWVPGEAPDLATAADAARRHAAEVLDELPHSVEVHETPAP